MMMMMMMQKGKNAPIHLGKKRSVFWVDKKKQKTCFLRIKSLIIVHVAAVTKRPVTKASEFGWTFCIKAPNTTNTNNGKKDDED